MPNNAPALPEWASEVIALYQSHAFSQFILYGNVHDRFILPPARPSPLGGLTDFLLKVLMPRFDVVLSFDLGNGIRVEKGGETFSQWPAFKAGPELPKSPRLAVETLTRYFRYCANLARLGKPAIQVGCWIRSADLMAPAAPGSTNYDLNAIALLMRDWATDDLLVQSPLVTCLLTDNLNDLHPLLSNNPRTAAIKIPLPTGSDLLPLFQQAAARFPTALAEFQGHFETLAGQFAGVTISAVENLLKTREYHQQKLLPGDVAELKKALVERECSDLIEFIEPRRTLADFHAQDHLKHWLCEDLALWSQGDVDAIPMGYLLCGPVGTGKTFMVECLAGEAGVPVVKIRNFRDKWIGSTEGNLEKIFRLLQSLGRCFVFVDEADQALGKREAGGSDGGLSGRVYAMFAKEMSNPANRGRVIWILASSRPDLIEVDLKRPGRVDVKIPIFPTTTTEESFRLLQALAARRGMELTDADFQEMSGHIPTLLTAGAAEVLAVKLYRFTKTRNVPPAAALKQALLEYQSPVPRDIMDFQINLAVHEATDIDFIPPMFRDRRNVPV